MGLEMKYFVLKPHGDSPNAIASRMAMVAYAESISSCDEELAQSLLSWVDREQAQPQQGESGNSSPTGQLTGNKSKPSAITPDCSTCVHVAVGCRKVREEENRNCAEYTPA